MIWIILAFGAHFISCWIRIRFRIRNADPDPDPGGKFNADPCGSGYGSGSETLGPGQVSNSFKSLSRAIEPSQTRTIRQDVQNFARSSILTNPGRLDSRVDPRITFWNSREKRDSLFRPKILARFSWDSRGKISSETRSSRVSQTEIW
jgi:hypothetical protein